MSCNHPRYSLWDESIRNNGRLQLRGDIHWNRTLRQQISFPPFVSLHFVRDHPPNYQLYRMGDTYIKDIWMFYNNVLYNVLLGILYSDPDSILSCMYALWRVLYHKWEYDSLSGIGRIVSTLHDESISFSSLNGELWDQ